MKRAIISKFSRISTLKGGYWTAFATVELRQALIMCGLPIHEVSFIAADGSVCRNFILSDEEMDEILR